MDKAYPFLVTSFLLMTRGRGEKGGKSSIQEKQLTDQINLSRNQNLRK
jgi:hypothetical protein